MGVFDEFCAVCGGAARVSPQGELAAQAKSRGLAIDAATLRALAKEAQWMNTWVGIAGDESLLRLGPYTGQGSFESAEDKGKFHLRTNAVSGGVPAGARYGVGCHRACWAVLQKGLGYGVRFADLYPRMKGKDGNLVEGVEYGPITQFHGPSFDLLGAYEAGFAWMLCDPTTNARNNGRILRTWRTWVREHGTAPTQGARGPTPGPRTKAPAAKKTAGTGDAKVPGKGAKARRKPVARKATSR